MDIDSLLEVVDCKLLEIQNRPLNFAEILILKGIWQYQTYNEIAEQGGYSSGYLTNVVAPELCRKLSQLVGQQVTKKNCRVLLELYIKAQTTVQASPKPKVEELSYPTTSDDSPCYPNGAVPLHSPFYIERTPVEAQVYEEIKKPGALIRIKAPQEMGKTSLLLRTLDYGSRLNYRVVSLNLEQIDQVILSDLNRFLRWLCANVSHQLELEPKLDDYWDEDIGSKISCTLYFRSYLLEQLDTPIILALDEVNHIFEHPQVAKDFLPLLRSWYEEAKRNTFWQKLRFVVVHSTNIYVPLQLNQSPFNVGLPIQLIHFNLHQVQELAARYGLKWTDDREAKQLMNLVDGHPSLINIALYHLSRDDITLSQLIQTAATSTGIFAPHLQRHWTTLQEQPKLADAFRQVIRSVEPVQLDPIIAYKLSSTGLIQQLDNKAMLSCELYRRYFERLYPEK